MDIKQLDQEKFNTLHELAELQENISLGRAALLDLKEKTEEYMVVREKEAEKRVLKILQESRDALDETTKNHDELSSYNSELKAYANNLNQIAIDIVTLFEDFNTRMRQSEIDMENFYKEVKEIMNSLKLKRISITEDRKILEGQKAEIRDGFRLLDDRRKLLEDGFKELKKLKAKKI